ncbi:hypothetical protein FRC09_002001 [Ceratobasidium sp. 395]|nr:hypothetical protein FRC09_002001 [Ceratobasidium sp. 395]
MPAHQAHRQTRRFGSFDIYSVSSRSAARRLRRLNVFTADEEHCLSSASAMLYAAMVAPNKTPTPSRSSVSMVRGATHPYPPLPEHRTSRKPASARGYIERANGARQLVDTPPAPSTQPSPSALPARAPLHLPTILGPAAPSTGLHTDPINPTSPDAWNPSRMAHSMGGHALGRSHHPLVTPRPRFSSPMSYFASTNVPGPSPLTTPLADPFLDFNLTHISSLPPGPIPLSQDLGMPGLTSGATPGGPRIPPAPEVAQPPSTSPAYLANHAATRLPLLAPLTLGPVELANKLSVGRAHHPWEDWERQLLIYALLVSRASPEFICDLFSLEKSQLVNDPYWAQVSAGPFNKARTSTALNSQWVVLRDAFLEFIYLVESAGIPLSRDPQAFVAAVLTAWQTTVSPGASWGTLNLPVVAAWTHDPVNGWLATIYKRFLEANVEISTNKALSDSQPAPVHSDWDSQILNEPGASASVLPAAESCLSTTPRCLSTVTALEQATLPTPNQSDGNLAQSAQSSQSQGSLASKDPTRSGTDNNLVWRRDESRGLEMMREHRFVSEASVTIAEGKANYLHGMAAEARTNAIGHLMTLEQQERKMRFEVAMNVIRACEPTSVNHQQAQSWLNQTFFSSHPSDDFARLLGKCYTKLNMVPAQLTYNPSFEDMFTTPALTSRALPSVFDSQPTE